MTRTCDCPCPKHDGMDDTDRWLNDMFPPEPVTTGRREGESYRFVARMATEEVHAQIDAKLFGEVLPVSVETLKDAVYQQGISRGFFKLPTS